MGLAPLVRLLRPLSALLVFAAVAGGVVMGVRLAAGDPPEPFTPPDWPPVIHPRPSRRARVRRTRNHPPTTSGQLHPWRPGVIDSISRRCA